MWRNWRRGGGNIEHRTESMGQENKYERECLGEPDKAGQGHCRVCSRRVRDAQKPFAPVAPPTCRQAQAAFQSPAPGSEASTHLLWFSVFSPLWTRVHQASSNAAALAFARVSAANRRQNHKKFALRARKAKLATTRPQKRRIRHERGTRRLFTLTAGRKRQRGGPRTREQSLNGSKT